MGGVKISIKFNGLDRLRLALLKKENLNAIKAAVKQNDAELQEGAQQNAPVDTGTLKGSIGIKIKDSGLTAEVTPRAHYAPYVEFGTRYMEAQPYLRPAFNTQKRIFLADLKRLTK